ncbi:P-loop NTPase fold protein, partial [Microbacterium sp.]|uniref:P-loop NTPase fold protein n=1 Tax=Microbacterium sp. TaxID=51671 RepID=UPI0031FE950C|nr:hypothetical protein [Microbacterium sp.]
EHAEPPFAVSLSGSWGVGKSAIAREAVTRLRDRGIRCVFIDAWTLDVDHLRRHLVIEVGAALRTGSSGDLPDKDDRKAVADKIDSAASQTTIQDAARVELRGLGDIARQIGDTPMTLVAILAVVAALLAIAYRTHGLDPFLLTIAGVLALALMTTYVVRLSTPSRSRAPAASEVLLADEFREIVSAAPRRKFIIGRAEPRQVVIVVDNLDRLTGRDALAALSQIRGLLEIDGSRCLFLIPIDRHRLEEHLRGELKRDTAAADYLEKFFGLDLALTQPQPVDLRRWATKRAHRIAPAEADDIELARMADVVTAATDRSPRMIVRVLNGAMSRHRVVSRMGRSLTLPQAALIEGVLLLANGRLAHLEKDPRSLIDLRRALVERWPDADKALANFFGVSVGEGSSMPAQAIRLAQFLRSTAHVPLAWEDVRIALALRKNRLWATVPDWETFAGPLEEGEVDAFAEALRDRSDRDSVVASSVEALIDLGRSFRTLVGLPVVAPHIGTDTPRAATLRALAIEFLAEDEWGFSRLTEDASHFLFEDAGETAPNLTSKLVAATTAASTPHSRGVVRALLLLRSKLSEADLDKVRKQLATWSHDELQPLFEEPTGTTFIEGPVAESMIATLESWDPSLTGSMSEQTMAARRLRAARDHGWSGAGLERVATRAANYTTQIAANEEAWPTAEAIIELLRGLDPTPEVDALGQSLGQPFAGDRQFFAWALQLNLSHTASVNVINRFDAWAKAAPLDRVAEVLDEHRAGWLELPPTTDGSMEAKGPHPGCHLGHRGRRERSRRADCGQCVGSG